MITSTNIHENITSQFERLYRASKATASYASRRTFFDQAFGMLQFAICIDPDHEGDYIDLWEPEGCWGWRSKFDALMWEATEK